MLFLIYRRRPWLPRSQCAFDIPREKKDWIIWWRKGPEAAKTIIQSEGVRSTGGRISEEAALHNSAPAQTTAALGCGGTPPFQVMARVCESTIVISLPQAGFSCTAFHSGVTALPSTST